MYFVAQSSNVVADMSLKKSQLDIKTSFWSKRSRPFNVGVDDVCLPNTSQCFPRAMRPLPCACSFKASETPNASSCSNRRWTCERLKVKRKLKNCKISIHHQFNGSINDARSTLSTVVQNSKPEIFIFYRNFGINRVIISGNWFLVGDREIHTEVSYTLQCFTTIRIGKECSVRFNVGIEATNNFFSYIVFNGNWTDKPFKLNDFLGFEDSNHLTDPLVEHLMHFVNKFSPEHFNGYICAKDSFRWRRIRSENVSARRSVGKNCVVTRRSLIHQKILCQSACRSVDGDLRKHSTGIKWNTEIAVANGCRFCKQFDRRRCSSHSRYIKRFETNSGDIFSFEHKLVSWSTGSIVQVFQWCWNRHNIRLNYVLLRISDLVYTSANGEANELTGLVTKQIISCHHKSLRIFGSGTDADVKIQTWIEFKFPQRWWCWRWLPCCPLIEWRSCVLFTS